MPPGTPSDRNYITPVGLAALEAELHELKQKERPEVTKAVAWAASNGDRSENGDYIYGKKRLREIDSRIHFLLKRIDAAEVVDPALIRSETVVFGATVTLQDEEGAEKTYTIVGTDETDIGKGRISWVSPLGSALLRAKARVGDYVTFKTPRGEQLVEVIGLRFESLE